MEVKGCIVTHNTSSCVDKSLASSQALESHPGPMVECSLTQNVDEVRFNLYIVLEL